MKDEPRIDQFSQGWGSYQYQKAANSPIIKMK